MSVNSLVGVTANVRAYSSLLITISKELLRKNSPFPPWANLLMRLYRNHLIENRGKLAC